MLAPSLRTPISPSCRSRLAPRPSQQLPSPGAARPSPVTPADAARPKPARPHQLRLARLPQGAGRFRAHHHAAARRRLRTGAARTTAPISSSSTPAAFSTARKAESLDAIGAALKENGKVIVTGCMGAEPEKITARFPNVLAVTGPQQYESVLDAVHRAAPPRHDPFLDLVPPRGHQADAAPLRVSEDFRGLQQPLQLLHHPEAARRPRLAARPPTCCARPNGWSRPASRSCWSSPRTPRPMASTSAMPRAGGAIASCRHASSISPRRSANSACGCGCTTSIPIPMSTR